MPRPGGALLYRETHSLVGLDGGGHFTVALGAGIPGGTSPPFDAALFSGANRWIEVVLVAPVAEALSPRIPLGSVPYALVAQQAASLLPGAIPSDASGVCRGDGGPGFLRNGVCVLAYANVPTTWAAASAACASTAGDLCSVSQYAVLRAERTAVPFTDLFYDGRAVWSSDASDNDGSTKAIPLASADDPTSQAYSYGCCGRITPEPFRSASTIVGGVPVLYVHPHADTTFYAAARVCASVGGDLCSKSQYVALDDAGTFAAAAPVWSSDASDNDAGLASSVVGATGDNPNLAQRHAYACCGTRIPMAGECPGRSPPAGSAMP